MSSSQSRSVITPQFANQCVDPAELDRWFDFNSLASPAPAGSRSSASTSQPRVSSALTSPISGFIPLDINEEQPTPIQPSHEYGRFKQTTGLPPNSIGHLRNLEESSRSQNIFSSYNTGFDELSLGLDGMGSQTGLGSVMSDLGMDLDGASPSFYRGGDLSQPDDFIDPATIIKEEEAQANIRFYPGMHQRAALARQAQQQKQQQLLQQRLKQREAEQQRNQAQRRPGPSQPLDPRTEETIARVVNQIRQSSNASGSGDSVSPNPAHVLPQIIKTRKDDEDMDEDERLLNSEEGKKLSSKERRQLRNKVSARAFRSRRKEYIGQLESEIAMKTNECNELKRQNHALMEENARFRSLAEKLLAHPAFHPFLDELSRDPTLAESLSKMAASTSRPTEAPAQTTNKDVNPYAANVQAFTSQPSGPSMDVNMAIIPEHQIDISSLNLGGNSNWSIPGMGLGTFQQPQVFAVVSVPEPPQPIDVNELSGKGEQSLLERLEGREDTKIDYPEVESPVERKTATSEAEDAQEHDGQPEPDFDENDPLVTLYATPAKSSSSSSAKEPVGCEPIFGNIPCEKAFAHFELFVSGEEDNQEVMDRFEKMVARLDASCRKLNELTARFGGIE